MNYRIKRGEQEFGPYSLAELKQYLAEGRVVPTDLARSEGMDDWAPVQSVIGDIGLAQPVHAALWELAQPGDVVVLRYLFDRPQVWTDELVGYLLVVRVMAGAADVLRRGEHIGVDLLTERLSPRFRRLAELWGLAAVILVSGCLVAAGWELAEFSYSIGLFSEGYLELPLWLPQAAVPAGAALLAIAAINRLLRLLLGLNGTEDQ